MKKQLLLFLGLLLLLPLLCGCTSPFEKEYVSVTEYVPPVQNEGDGGERVTVRNMAELKRALIDMVYAGSTGGSIAFDPNYDGNAQEDMESACWQVRTQDSLCAYCVRDLSYEMEKIVNYYESTVNIDYTSYAAELSSIIQLPYAVGVEDYLSTAMSENRTRLTILIRASSYSAEKIKSLALEIYRSHPTICVREPQITVHMYSGSARQRLYDISFAYGMADDELIRCKSQLVNLDVMSNLDAYGLDEPHRALAAYSFLSQNCIWNEHAKGSCYDALINGETNSEGLALAYVEMCHQLDLDCRIVYGQIGGKDHCWNIVRLAGDYYHVDVSACCGGKLGDGFLKNDEQMWNDYRWSISNYPACSGGLSYAQLVAEDKPEAPAAVQNPAGEQKDTPRAEPSAEPSGQPDEPTPEPEQSPEPDPEPEESPAPEEDKA